MTLAVWSYYKQMLTKNPMLTKATTSSILMFCSDVICQQYEIHHSQNIVEYMKRTFQLSEHQVNLQNGCPTNVCNGGTTDEALPTQKFDNEKQLKYDVVRSLHLAITGFIFSGPISHVWYNVLERIVVRPTLPRYRWLGMVQRLAYDAFLFTPIAVGGYFIVRGSLEGRSIQGIYDKLELKWMGATYASWNFWPIANVVNFAFVPIQFRVLYNNVLSLFWNTYLSRLNGQRLQNVVIDRQQGKMKLVTNGIELNSSKKNKQTICVCSHCREIRS